MNKVIITGNLTKDVALRETSSGKKVATLTVAVNGLNDTTDFFQVNVWNGTAENCSKFLSKGKKVAVVGELHNRTYEDKDGNKKTITEITANEVEFLSPKTEEKTITSREKEFKEIDDNQLPF